MKTLLLLRHAKSSWSDDSLDDHDRPLNKRGKKAAPVMGKLMRREGIVPDLIISSTANRAQSTARIVAEHAGAEGDIVLDRGLYLAPPQSYIRVASQVDGSVEKLMMVGHNTGIASLVELLTAHDEAMPTAALAHIMIPIDMWLDLSMNLNCELSSIWRPKEIA